MKGNIFIKRPVMAMSIAIMILLVGAISYFNLPMESYPDIAPPTVSVEATYTGADASAVMNAVIQPLEESINGVENMLYMTSTATNAGSARITIYFKQGSDPDMAAVNVQNRVSKAQGLLPQEVTQIGVTTTKRQTSFLQIDALTSSKPEFDEDYIANYLDINIIPQLKRVEGVGDVMELGGTYSLRIWLKPDIMAQYSVVPSDVTEALAEQNLEAPVGQLGEKPVNGTHGDGVDNVFQYTMKYTGRLKEIEQFENMVIKANDDGTLLRLKDIAEIELGAEQYTYHGEVNGNPGVQFLCYQLAGTNAKETNDRVTAKLDELSKNLPQGLQFVTLMSSNDFLLESVKNVEETLIIAIILVVFVVYFFLQNFRATLIPSISIIVSLVGTFACLQVAGFSLNLLTLFALVLAIGTVVDDAIVVVEAVQAKFDAGYKSPYEATKDAMADVTMAVISCTFVFMAVFIPVSFMGGTSGVFYTQFGVTLATAVGISCVSALVLCPALCAMMMRSTDEDAKKKGLFGLINKVTKKAYEATYETLRDKYASVIHHCVQRKLRYLVSFGSLVVAIIGMIFFANHLSVGLVPTEDQGVCMMNVSTVPGNNVASSFAVLQKAEDIVKEIPEVRDYSEVAGYSFLAGQGTSYAMMVIRLKQWDERRYGFWRPLANFMSTSTMVANAKLNAKLVTAIPEAQCFVFEPGMIPGYGMGSIELNLQDKTSAADKETFYNYTQKFIEELNKRKEISRAITTYARNFPQLQVEVDAAQCKRAGISPSSVLSELGSYCGGSYVSNMNQFSKVYRVMIEAATTYRTLESDLNNMYVKNGDEMAPISQFVKLSRIEGPEIDNRFNLFSSITVNITPATGSSDTDVMLAVQKVAKDVFPDGYDYEYGGIAREEAQQIGSIDTYIIYAVCVVLIFLILSCLYESFLVPFAVILSVPAGLMGTYLFAWLWNQGYNVLPIIFMGQIENNIYLQTGVIMLIGLLAKTAILITEFALERRRKGMGIVEAAVAAAEARLRPILMTVLTMIFGMIPLVLATGAGSNGNRTIGLGTVGGMVVGTIAILFTVPLFFIIFEFLQERIRPVMQEEADAQFLKERVRSQKAKERHQNEDNK
ncbi:MAG: efflux RND transporter permease subunit [Prevotellaceae bacterium]|nr:efflux RND transporter permease subunit [Prevotellaceae bacterium]